MHVLLATLCLLHLAAAGIDTTICTTPYGQQHTRPSLPQQFEVHVECNFLDLNTTTEVHEYYDDINNRGEVRVSDFGVKLWAYYSYDTNELISILPDKSLCYVEDLQKNSQRYLFGYQSKNGQGHIFSASGALHFGEANTVEVFQGADVVRGINVQKWYSCLYWAGMDATMNVTWYFSDPLNWETALAVPSTPVRVHVRGRRTKNGSPYDFEHYYDFLHFKPYIEDPQNFETPNGISCPGRKNTKPLPVVAPAYSLIIEIVDNVRSQISFMKEYYDQSMKLTKFMYKPSHTTPSIYGYNPLTEIHDFNTGVAYVIDPLIGNCSFRPIEHGTFDDATAKNPHLVRMRTSQEFFYLNSQDVTYEGVKTVRNIDMDTWVGRRNTFQGFDLNSTWQWYFKLGTWSASQQRVGSYSMGTPLMLTIDVHELSVSYTYNIYNFIQARPNLLDFDISSCFMDLKRRKFDFKIPTEARDLVDRNKELFKYSVLMSLTYYTAVFPLRISNLRVVYDDHIHIRFEILDVRPVTGDVTVNSTETPLDVAAQHLVSKVNNNEFVIYVMQPGVSLQETPYIVAVPDSITEFTYESELAEFKGYSPGALGGLSAAMIVVGGALGAGLSFVFFK
ncbi:uncharacterized protein [Haliotis cracherodii]|uniref:uncharacterized protein n=1 Tax=Haliotis cracherodii TaxID=6455 RepID=UPI0039EA760E